VEFKSVDWMLSLAQAVAVCWRSPVRDGIGLAIIQLAELAETHESKLASPSAAFHFLKEFLKERPVPHSAVKQLTQELLQTTAEQALHSPRLRQNYNFHNLNERVQRFINVMQPGTYVRPHCHHRPADVNGFEFFLVIQGALGMVVLDDQGTVLESHCISDRGPVRAIELAEGTYHTLVVLEPNTAILEIKEGPYNPQTDKHFLAQFPAEGTPEAQALVKTWESYFDPLRPQSLL